MTSTDPGAGLREFEHALAINREIDDAEQVAYAYGSLVDSLIRLGRLDEAVATAREAAEIGSQLGALRSWLVLFMFNGAEALFLAGRWNECEHALGRLRDLRAGGPLEIGGLALGALLDACRGRDAAAAAVIIESGGPAVDDAQNVGILCAAQAQLALNVGDLTAAHRVALAGLDVLSDADHESPEVVSATSLAGLALQIEADRAQLGRAHRDPMEERGAVDSARMVAARTLSLRARASAAAHRPAVTRSHQTLCEAEIGRAEGRSDPDSWRRAADAGAAEGEPHRVAHARFREAEAVLASRGDRARAGDALTAANATANDLGAEPLRREIEALARRARIELTGEPSPATRPSPPEPTLASLGLTPRELEVLRLLAAGYTNPQIGEALYISRKTASHHVSSVLTKLGVTTRVEAAGVAHRVGLTSEATASK